MTAVPAAQPIDLPELIAAAAAHGLTLEARPDTAPDYRTFDLVVGDHRAAFWLDGDTLRSLDVTGELELYDHFYRTDEWWGRTLTEIVAALTPLAGALAGGVKALGSYLAELTLAAFTRGE